MKTVIIIILCIMVVLVAMDWSYKQGVLDAAHLIGEDWLRDIALMEAGYHDPAAPHKTNERLLSLSWPFHTFEAEGER